MSDSFNILHYMYFFNGAGIAVGDINNDGLDDLYFAANQGPGALYLNEGELSFQDITEKSLLLSHGWATGVTIVDVNADGWKDIYICMAGDPNGAKRKNMLWINNGNLTFSEQAESYGIADSSYSTHATFFDFDRDGDLDMYLLNHHHQFIGTNAPLPKKNQGESPTTDKLFENLSDTLGHPVFRDISQSAEIRLEGFGLGVSIADLNDDGWPDIYVSNDFLSNDILYINNQDGTFSNRIGTLLSHQSHNGMGNDIADINNDGLPDIFVADMLPSRYEDRQLMAMNTNEDLFNASVAMGYEPQYARNTLQLNNGSSPLQQFPFSEIGQLAGVHRTDWSWGPLLFDFDNDGWKDLFITNGYFRDITNLDFINYRKKRSTFTSQATQDSLYIDLLAELSPLMTPNMIFRNLQNYTFTDKSAAWGVNQPSLSNGAATADLDLDGDLDLVVNNINQTAFLYENQSNLHAANEYVRIRLVGTKENPQAIGAKLMVFTPTGIQYYENQLSHGYASSINSAVHIGLSSPSIDSLVIHWPDGQTGVSIAPDKNRELVIHYGDQKKRSKNGVLGISTETIFDQCTERVQLDFKHIENEFQEFKTDRSLIYALAKNGPGVAAGDLNGDGLDDFFLGGAAGYSANLFLQKRNGTFTSTRFHHGAEFEDVYASIFDADNDGDQDLYVASGGTEFQAHSNRYQDRLYKNNGKGQFTYDSLALPSLTVSSSCVSPCDFDKDGDIDLFVGGRVIPGFFPLNPESFLLLNENGKFLDKTIELARPLQHLGMTTAAVWCDYNNDTWMDLVVVGDWMPISFFKNQHGSLTADTLLVGENLNTSGWWRSIAAGDFDGDGDQDLVVGNLGLNTDFKVNAKYPASVYYGDFDQNGSSESILSYFQINARGFLDDYPISTRDELVEILPSLPKTFTNYQQFAQANLRDLIAEKETLRKQVTVQESVYLQNNGDETFAWRVLPKEVQFSTINDFLIHDFDADGHLDLLLAGNFYDAKVSIGRHDASIGLFLRGTHSGWFDVIPPRESGFSAAGNVRHLTLINMSEESIVLVSRNNDLVTAFRF